MRVNSVTSKKVITGVIYLLIITVFSVTLFYKNVMASNISMPLSKKIILIDAGHGGWDSGAISGNTEEKNINLEISKKLQSYLEQADATVFMTRIDDAKVAQSKKDDMYSRKLIAERSKADVFISIHQNFMSISSIHGAQVFYYRGSENSKHLAECIQNEIKAFVINNNTFVPKENESYYVLRQTPMPAVIVECGYITNQIEKQQLLNPDYQERVAWAIYMGIVDYFSE